MIAHNGSGFDSYVVLNNLHQWGNVIDLKKKGTGIVSLIIYNSYIDERKKILKMTNSDVGECILIAV